MDSQEYFNKQISKKAAELLETEFKDVYLPLNLIEILNEGARIQEEVNNINHMAELWEIDSFEEAKEMWEAMIENKKAEQIHLDKKEVVPVEGCDCMACTGKREYNERIKSFDTARKAGIRHRLHPE